MRIRRRPSSLLSSLPLVASDPSNHQLFAAQNVTNYTNGIKGLVVQVSRGDQQLHPAELTELSEESERKRGVQADGHSDLHLKHVNQMLVGDEVKEEEIKIEMVDSKDSVAHQLNSSKRINGSSTALICAVSPQKKRNAGEVDIVAVTTVSTRRAKARRARRGSDDGGVAPLSNNCTSVDASDDGCNDDNDTNGSENVELIAAKSGSNNGSKKRRSPAVLMEGSRCSRVNGRGWRCCQQTLVGYSLCEHHLGKGRLRSMNSVRGQLGTSKPQNISNSDQNVKDFAQPLPPVSTISLNVNPVQQQHSVVLAVDTQVKDDDEVEVKKKRKIGLIKARSISSLLEPSSLPSSNNSFLQSPEIAPSDGTEAML